MLLIEQQGLEFHGREVDRFGLNTCETMMMKQDTVKAIVCFLDTN